MPDVDQTTDHAKVLGRTESVLRAEFGDDNVTQVSQDETSAVLGLHVNGTDYSLMVNVTP